MARQRKDLIREAIQEIVPCTLIEQPVRQLGVAKRSRLCDPVELVVHMPLVGGTAEAGRLAAVLRDQFHAGKPRTARSAAHRWFDEDMLALLQRLVEHARGYALAMPTSLPGILAGRRDCRLFDSSTVKLADAQVDTRPGTGDYAALETHAEYSVGVENVVDYSIGPAREHDGPKLVVDENRSRTGILMDLGCTSHDTIRRCEQFDVAFVIGGKTCWNLDLDDSVSAEHKAQKPVSELIMVHASMIATMLTNAVCHAAHVEDVG